MRFWPGRWFFGHCLPGSEDDGLLRSEHEDGNFHDSFVHSGACYIAEMLTDMFLFRLQFFLLPIKLRCFYRPMSVTPGLQLSFCCVSCQFFLKYVSFLHL